MSYDYTLGDLAMRFDDGITALQNAVDALERIATALDALTSASRGASDTNTREQP